MGTKSLSGKALYNKIRDEFLGLNTTYTLATGETSRRIYLDSSATTLMMKMAYDVLEKFYHHYANTHSLLYFGARISTQEYEWAHNRIISFVGADPDTYTCFFTGSGTTGGINRMASVFRDIRPEKDTTIVSIMEHHSNDIPHRKHMKRILHIPVEEREGGMVRASFALYSTLADADSLIDVINNIVKRKDFFRSQYDVDERGNYMHNTFQFDQKAEFSILNCLSEIIT